MSKKYYITESQMRQVINHIKNGEGEILEEGAKEWMLAGLMTLASIAGVKAQTTPITPDHVKAAEQFQERLDAGDKEVIKYFKAADIEWNRANVEKLKGVDDADFTEFETKSSSTARAKIKQGFAVESVEITRDTVWETPSVVNVEVVGDTIDFGGSSDQMFKTGSFELTSQSMNDLNSMIDSIGQMGAKIVSVNIESSTDKEPIKMGNDVLAQKRANVVKQVLTTLGVDVPIEINTLPEQGPDVYSDNMTKEERKNARQQTSEYRYVRVTFVVTIEVPPIDVPADEKVVDYVKEKVKFHLVKVKEEYKGGYKWKGKTSKPKKLKCIKVKLDVKELPCSFITGG